MVTHKLSVNGNDNSQLQTLNYAKSAPRKRNVTKLRKSGSRRNVGPSFFVTIFKIQLDKSAEMCGHFANCG